MKIHLQILNLHSFDTSGFIFAIQSIYKFTIFTKVLSSINIYHCHIKRIVCLFNTISLEFFDTP